MKYIILIFAFSIMLIANSEVNSSTTDNNNSLDKNSTLDNNATLQKQIQKQIEKEKIYQKEQKFYMGDEYNLTEHQVDPKTVDKVPVIEPEYDFDITDLYAD